MAGDPVLRWVGDARVASKATGVPVDVLLGLVAVESGGVEGRTSSAGAGGLTQFMPGTARSYAVNVAPGHAPSQLMGAARYLVDLGYHRDPARALASYNGGPGKPQFGYAAKVQAAARRYRGAGGTPAPAQPSSSPAAAAPDASGELVTAQRRSDLVRAVTWVGLATGGIALAGLGVRRTVGAA